MNFSEKIRKTILKSYETHIDARLNIINQDNGSTEVKDLAVSVCMGIDLGTKAVVSLDQLRRIYRNSNLHANQAGNSCRSEMGTKYCFYLYKSQRLYFIKIILHFTALIFTCKFLL